jgi:glycosyltransferase involved in cell wall biosynthesis
MDATKPRHCMVVHAYYPLAETRVQREAEVLVKAGYEVDVICLRGIGHPPLERYRDVTIHRLPVRLNKSSLARQFIAYLRFLILATARLTRLHLRTPYRSVQVHNVPDFLVFCALIPKLQGVPVILDLHDLMPEFFGGRFGSRRPLMARLIRKQERLACLFADHVITVSEHWRQALIRRGVPRNKCSVVMNVADESVFVRRGRRQPPPGDFRLIYHGTVTFRYGLDLAIQAISRLRDEIPEIRLVIIGKGDAMPDLFALRGELGLEDHVDLRNEFVLSDHLSDVISEAHVGVVPYRNDPFTDGLLPTKLMEYAVMGLPCIASRTTAMEAYFKDTMVEFFEPGSVEDLARRIRELHRNPERRDFLARRSTIFTDRHNWDRAGADYVAILQSLASQAATGSHQRVAG